MPALFPDTTPQKSNDHAYTDAYAKFIEIAAHDLRAPLRKLGVLTDRLTANYEQVAGDEVKQYTKRIHASIAEMQALIEGFTEYAGAAPFTMELATCDLATITKKVLQELNPLVKENNAEINVGDLPVIQGDCTQLQLMIKKILDNSFRFRRPADTLKISITADAASADELHTHGLDAEKKFHRIIIADNGIGFAGQDAGTIFNPLVRLNGKSSYPGSGMGLATVKRIVENHQGAVFAEGKENGAAIILLLPENQEQ